jgi:hypothetical protein
MAQAKPKLPFWVKELPADKKWVNICGCMGTVSCDCGFEFNYCSPQETDFDECPYCGKTTKRQLHKMWDLWDLQNPG